MKRRLPVILILVCLGAALFAGAQAGSAKPVPRGPQGFFGIGPQTVLTEKDVEYMKAGGIDSDPLAAALERDPADQARRLPLGRLRRSRRAGVPPGPRGAAVPLQHAALDLPQVHEAAGRQRPGPRRLDRLPESGGGALRPRRGLLERARARSRPVRAGDPPAAADPHLADLERGQLLLLRLPRYAAALREAGADLQSGDQTGRPRRQSALHRPLRRTDRERPARHGRHRLPRRPLSLRG